MLEGEELVKAVVEEVSILGVFIKNDFGNVDVADFTV